MFKNILVAIDGSATAETGLRQAIALASQSQARLSVLYVLDVYRDASELQMATADLYERHLEATRRYGRELLDRAAAQAAAAGVQAQTILREVGVARIADAIVWEGQKGFDLIVLGTHGRRGFRRFFLGSDAELVVRSATIPVLLIRAESQGAQEAAEPGPG